MIYNGKEKRQKLIDILGTELHGLHCCFYILQQCNPCNSVSKYIHNWCRHESMDTYNNKLKSAFVRLIRVVRVPI